LQAQQMAGYTPHVVTSLGFPRTKGIETYPSTQLVDGVCHHRIDQSDVPDPRTLPHDFYVTLNAHLAATIADEIEPSLLQAGTGFRGYERALSGTHLSDGLSVPFVYEVRGFQEESWTSVPARGDQCEYCARRFAQETRCMDRAGVVITIADSMAEE